MASIYGVPFVKTVADCANYDITVKPFLQAVADLPAQLSTSSFQGLTKESLVRLYLDTNPLAAAFIFSLLFGVVFLVVSEANRNYSQVDRMWSILPNAYTLHFNIWARQHGVPNPKLDLILLCTTVWSLRLTFNYWRRGGYSIGSEDYRWNIVKAKIGTPAMFALNVTFISFVQSVLLFLLASPVYVQLLVSRVSPELALTDLIFGSIILSLVLIEFTADSQQWDYQQAKHSYLKTAKLPANSKYSQEALDRGFVVSGLWSWVRHPNFAAEQAIWIVMYQWAAFNSQSPLNWTAAGFIGLLGIFFGSTRLTEAITVGKYPTYKEYQSLIPMFIPSVLGGVLPSREKKD